MWLTETGGSLPLSHSCNVRPGTCRVYQSNASLGFSLSWCLVLVVEMSFGLLSQHIHPWPDADGQCCASLPEGLVFPVVSGVVFIYYYFLNFLEGFAALQLIAVANSEWRFLFLVCQPKWLCHHPAPPDVEQQLMSLWINSPRKSKSLDILWAELYIW